LLKSGLLVVFRRYVNEEEEKVIIAEGVLCCVGEMKRAA